MYPWIRLRCPSCDARIKAPAQLSGQWRNCPRCRRLLVIKQKPPEDADPVLYDDTSSHPAKAGLL